MPKTEKYTTNEKREAFIAGVRAVFATRTGVLALSMLAYKHRPPAYTFDALGNVLKIRIEDYPNRIIIPSIEPIWRSIYPERPKCVTVSRDDGLLHTVNRIDGAKCHSCMLFQHGVCEAGVRIPSPLPVNQPESNHKRVRRPRVKILTEAI